MNWFLFKSNKREDDKNYFNLIKLTSAGWNLNTFSFFFSIYLFFLLGVEFNLIFWWSMDFGNFRLVRMYLYIGNLYFINWMKSFIQQMTGNFIYTTWTFFSLTSFYVFNHILVHCRVRNMGGVPSKDWVWDKPINTMVHTFLVLSFPVDIWILKQLQDYLHMKGFKKFKEKYMPKPHLEATPLVIQIFVL